MDAFSTLRPDPFAPGAGASEPDAVPDGAGGIVVDLPDPAPAEGALSPIIPDPEHWAMHEPAPLMPDDVQLPADPAPEPYVGHDVAPAPLSTIDGDPITPIQWYAAMVADDVRAQGTDTTPDAIGREPDLRLTHAGSGWQVGGMFPATAMADDGALALPRADTRWALSDLSAPGDVIAEAVVDFTAGSGLRHPLPCRPRRPAISSTATRSTSTRSPAGAATWCASGRRTGRTGDPSRRRRSLDPTRLLGRRTIAVSIRGDSLSVEVDGEPVLTVASLSHASIELGREPCRGDRLGIQAAASTAEVTVGSAVRHAAVASAGRGARRVRARSPRPRTTTGGTATPAR